MPFKDLPEGQTHYYGDGCEPAHEENNTHNDNIGHSTGYMLVGNMHCYGCHKTVAPNSPHFDCILPRVKCEWPLSCQVQPKPACWICHKTVEAGETSADIHTGCFALMTPNAKVKERIRRAGQSTSDQMKSRALSTYLPDTKDWENRYPLNTFYGSTKEKMRLVLHSVAKHFYEEGLNTKDKAKKDML